MPGDLREELDAVLALVDHLLQHLQEVHNTIALVTDLVTDLRRLENEQARRRQ